jgi:hypothetical protein
MKVYNNTLKDLNWNELLREVAIILKRDTQSLETNMNHYRRLLADESSLPEQVNLFYEKLEVDRQRLSYFNALYTRLQQNDFKFILASLLSELEKQKQLQTRFIIRMGKRGFILCR